MKLHDTKNTVIRASRVVAVQDPEPAPRQIVTLTTILLLDFGPLPKMTLQYNSQETREADHALLAAAIEPAAEAAK